MPEDYGQACLSTSGVNPIAAQGVRIGETIAPSPDRVRMMQIRDLHRIQFLTIH
jgi:hypothetical protein